MVNLSKANYRGKGKKTLVKVKHRVATYLLCRIVN